MRDEWKSFAFEQHYEHTFIHICWNHPFTGVEYLNQFLIDQWCRTLAYNIAYFTFTRSSTHFPTRLAAMFTPNMKCVARARCIYIPKPNPNIDKLSKCTGTCENTYISIYEIWINSFLFVLKIKFLHFFFSLKKSLTVNYSKGHVLMLILIITLWPWKIFYMYTKRFCTGALHQFAVSYTSIVEFERRLWVFLDSSPIGKDQSYWVAYSRLCISSSL